jgi:AraC-like DNA-binding protein/quercetin dioxygenase-like cupin family protein
MLSKQKASLLEPVTHETGSRPISFHHTLIEQGSELVLYLHWHSEIEFLLIMHGETIFCIEEQEYYMKAGDAIFVPPNLLHMAKSINGNACEFNAIVFSQSYLTDFYQNPHYTKYMLPIKNYSLRCPLQMTSDISWHKDIINSIDRIYHLTQDNPEQSELQVHGMLLMVWQWIYNNHLSKIEVSIRLSRLALQLENAINEIHNSYNDMITLSKLASLSNLSEGQFCRLFKQLTDVTPFSYINRYRVIKSCEYLSNTSKKVAEIATLCGFNNISYYNREFNKYIKVTPSEYRNALQ